MRECWAEVVLHDGGDPDAALAIIDDPAALRHHPVSAWSMRVRADSLREIATTGAIGDPRDAEAEASAAEAAAEAAWARADVAAGVPSPLPSSCLTFSVRRSPAAPPSPGSFVENITQLSGFQLALAVLMVGVVVAALARRFRRPKHSYRGVGGDEAKSLVEEQA